MLRTLIITGAALGLAGGTAWADSGSSKEEAVGVGIGATVGAVSAGPVGAVIGAAIGAKFGDTFHRKNETVATLSASLEDSSQRIAGLQRTVDELNGNLGELDGDLRRLRRSARPELVSLLQTGIEMDLLFRTDEHVLNDGTGERLRQLAATLASMPDVQVRLDGFADERGDETYNRTLSEKRAQYVRELLIVAGVDAGRITATAHGESPARDAGADSYALERRVSLTLYIDGAPSVAAHAL